MASSSNTPPNSSNMPSSTPTNSYVPPSVIPTGCWEIDEMLGGGVKVGEVTELCGEHGIGKTQFCLQFVLSGLTWLANQGVRSHAIYLSSNMAFPARRLHEISQRFTSDFTILRDILIRDVDHADDISDAFMFVKEFIEHSPNKTHVVVFDSISMLFSKPTSNVEDLRYKTILVRSTGYGLQRLASMYNVAVLVCNTVVNSYDPVHEHNFFTSGRLVKPAVGKAWEKYIHSRLLLVWDDLEDATQVRVVYLEKGREGNGAKRGFAVTRYGIEIVPEPPSEPLSVPSPSTEECVPSSSVED